MSKMGAAQFFKKTLKAQGLIDNKVVKEVAESASTLGKNVKGTFAPNGKVSGSAVTKALLTKDDKYGRRMGNLRWDGRGLLGCHILSHPHSVLP